MNGRRARTEAFGIPGPYPYGTPPLGHGLGQRQRLEGSNFWPGVIVGFIFGAIVLTATGRKIVYRAGERVARRI